MPTVRHTTLDEYVAVRTPEHVALAFDVAGIGSRSLAYLIDWLLRFVAAALLIFALERLGGASRYIPVADEGRKALIFFLFVFLLMWVYMPLFEVLWEGQTPGKRLTQLRVIKDDGTPITVPDAVLRNVLRVVDFLPAFYGLGVFVMFLNRQSKRIGDFAAGTVVVKERQFSLDQYLAQDAAAGWVPAGADASAPDRQQPPVLAPAEYELLTRFLERRSDFDATARVQLAERLATPYRQRAELRAVADSYRDDESLLEYLAARGTTTVTAARTPRHPAGARLTAPRALDRFVAARRARWQHLDDSLRTIGKRGLKALTHQQLARLGRLYRNVSADHALAQTYYPGAAVAGYLNRLVAATHNRIYRRTGWTWRTLLDFYAVEVPATFQRYRRYFWLSAGAFFGPAFAAFGLVLVMPQFAELIISPGMLDSIARQEMWTDDLWVHTPGQVTDVSIRILANNITVTMMVFASGIAACAGTIYYLALNGFMLGAVSALTWQHGMARAFWSFVTPHGVIEISMILIGGMGGFILGACLLNPGRYTRRDAFRLHGRAAVRLMLACIPVLICAGFIEGYFSPMPGAFWFKQAFGMTLGLILFAYLLGRSPRRDVVWDPSLAPTAAPAPSPPGTG